jgi:addiction module HigA family antidote
MRPIHPGEILREELLVPLRMSAHALSQASHVPATRVNDIVNGKRGVTADTALRVARYFGNTRSCGLICRPRTICAQPNVAPPRESSVRCRGGRRRMLDQRATRRVVSRNLCVRIA